MAVKIHEVKSTEFRTNIADIIRNLDGGNDVYLLKHYNRVVGYITPNVPPKILGRAHRSHRRASE